MAFTIGSGTFTNGSATVTGVTLTSGTLAYFASGTRMVVGVNPVIQEVEAIAAPSVSTITLRSAWTGTGGTYQFLANQTSEGLRDAVQAIRTNNASLQSFIDSIDTAATADSVAQRTSDGSLNAVNVYASGNLGVGTASPAVKAHFKNDGNSQTKVLIENADTTTANFATQVYYQLAVGGDVIGGLKAVNAPLVGLSTKSLYLTTEGNYPIAFGLNNTASPSMVLDTSGNLLVGTTSQISFCNHSAANNTTNVSTFGFQNDASSTPRAISTLLPNAATGYHLICSTLGADKLYIYASGDVVNTNNSYGSLSDVKLKENIEPATPKLDKLMQVEIVNYNMIGDEQKQIGVTAQQLEQVFPSLVSESDDFEKVQVPQLDEDGEQVLDEEGNPVFIEENQPTGTKTKSVKYSVFVPILIKAMQEQQAIIDDLKARIEALEG